MPVRRILVATACVIVVVSWLLLVVDGLVEGNWMQLFWQFLLAMMALDWWRDRRGKPSVPKGTPRQRLASGAIALVIGIGGGAMVVTQEAFLGRIAGGILVVVALGFLYLVLSSIRENKPPAETT
ncbi:peptidoglycan/LPS O-acetylase OafA/YrhL [Prescottella agglutinans]|uniref:Peptidoglycan/LPS O-acetylase OafA/YrhL n=1 Tax=Prescottella agglutinans TaxID=1644129 RepID=A0ABT6M5Z9_9NOCA|nr:peptidoglycan/LPS O-acetylase OafA/YrhL [Prescottella agglutinans]